MAVHEEVYLWPDESIDVGNLSGVRPRLTVYQPWRRPREGDRWTDGPRRGVVVLAGGGYGNRSEHEGPAYAEWLALQGFVAVVCDYRVAPHRHPAPFADAARAMRLTRHHADRWGIDPANIAIIGSSAGGHLAATIAVQPDLHREPSDDLLDRYSARPDRLALVYPVISMIAEHHQGSVNALLGPEADGGMRRQLSHELHVDAHTPPTFMVHAADDGPVPVSNSLRFAEALAKHDVPFEMHVYPQGGHGFGLALERPGLGNCPHALVEWLRR